MARIIIFAGASGAGKSFLIEQIAGRDPGIEPIKKLSTRPAREYERTRSQFVDLYFGASEANIRNCRYKYSYGQHLYGLDHTEIEYHLSRGKTPAVIIRNSEIVSQLKRDYPDSIAVYVQSILSGDDLSDTLEKTGMSDIDLRQRMARQETDFLDYCRHSDLYDHVVLNNFNRVDFLGQYESIIERENRKPTSDGSICYLTSGDPHESYRLLAQAMQNVGVSPERLVRFAELDDGPVIAESIEKRLLRSDVTIFDFDQSSATLAHYVAVLKANRKPFRLVVRDTAASNDNYFRRGGFESINVYSGDQDHLSAFEGILKGATPAPEQGEIGAPVIRHFMERAIEACKKSTFEDDTPRPYVGAVLIDEKNVELLAAYRGGDNGNKQHAEFQLLTQLETLCEHEPEIRSRLRNFTLFVTLEPCTSRGPDKTPCADRVISSGIGSIFVGMLDPDIRIRGIGVQKLKDSGLRVEMFPDALEREIRQQNGQWIDFVKDRDYG